MENAISHVLLSHRVNQNGDLRPAHLRLPTTLNPLTIQEMPTDFAYSSTNLSSTNRLSGWSCYPSLCGALPCVVCVVGFLSVVAVAPT